MTAGAVAGGCDGMSRLVRLLDRRRRKSVVRGRQDTSARPRTARRGSRREARATGRADVRRARTLDGGRELLVEL
jgi:hypothetical protein